MIVVQCTNVVVVVVSGLYLKLVEFTFMMLRMQFRDCAPAQLIARQVRRNQLLSVAQLRG